MILLPPAEILQNFFGVFLQFLIGVDTLSAAPEAEEALDISDAEVPLSAAPQAEDDPAVDIADVDVPLADVPHTGDSSQIWETLTLVSAAGLVWLVMKNRKREEA